jgi:hypothetical protein
MIAVLHRTEQGRAGAPETATPSSSPELLLINSSGRDEILADGKDFARIQVHFMDPQGAAAPSDIKVWLTWSNGTLNPQPLVIKKGQVVGEAHWTSRSPVDATGSIVATAPLYSVNGERTLRVPFVPPIYGIGLSTESPLKLSLVDRAPVIAQFFDDQGRTVETSKPRRVTFVSSNPSLHAAPSEWVVKPNESAAPIFLWATWFGQSTLDIWTPGYAKQTIVVNVTIYAVLITWLIAGTCGGLLAKVALARNWVTVRRILIGIGAALILVWLHMWVVPPGTGSIAAPGTISVIALSFLGGFTGSPVLEGAGRLMVRFLPSA